MPPDLNLVIGAELPAAMSAKRPRPDGDAGGAGAGAGAFSDSSAWQFALLETFVGGDSRLRPDADAAAFAAHCAAAAPGEDRTVALHVASATVQAAGGDAAREAAGRRLLRGGLLAPLRDWVKDGAAAAAPAGTNEAAWLLQVLQVRCGAGGG